MLKDIELVDIILKMNKRDIVKNEFCWLYPFSNENINECFNHFDFLNKSVLTVTSSGDHAINALLHGAKNVDSFDKNVLAKYYSELKIACIKTLSLEEFVLFLYNKCFLFPSKQYMNEDIYNKVRKNLDGDFLKFWDHIFNNYSSKQIYNSFLFSGDYFDKCFLKEINSYLDYNSYIRIRKILYESHISYHDIDVLNLCNINKKFDIISLSNIPSLLDKKELLCLKKNLDCISKKNTSVILCYLYSEMLNYVNNGIYNNNIVKDMFSLYEYLHINNPDSYLSLKKDLILINKKNY